jgi:hypothetical protein
MIFSLKYLVLQISRLDGLMDGLIKNLMMTCV